MRYAANGGGRAAPLRAHVAYLSREGAQRGRTPEIAADSKPDDPTRSVDYLTREEAGGSVRFAFYDRASDTVDARSITASWSEDPRHFRMIVSAEDGAALGDLRPFIREVMAGLEAKLGTRLEWLAVDHHDTDNPHTHVLIRGRRPDGQELFIPSRLISSGIREQAQEIVTRVLGPRLDVDLVQERFADISRMAVTPLDRELAASRSRRGPDADATGSHRPAGAAGGVGSGRTGNGWLASRRRPGDCGSGPWPRMRTWCERLRQCSRAGSRALSSKPIAILPSLGNSSISAPSMKSATSSWPSSKPAAGNSAMRGSNVRRISLSSAGAEPGAIVSFEPNVPDRPSLGCGCCADRREKRRHLLAENPRVSWSRTSTRDLSQPMFAVSRSCGAWGWFSGPGMASSSLAATTSRTRWLSRSGWFSRAPFSAQVASYWSLSEQVEARAPTHLDRVLVGDAEGPSGEARIAREFEQALQQRRLFLIEQGWMAPHEAAPSRQAMQRLAQLELTNRARVLSGELGMPVLTYDAHRVSGVYARRIDLAQGRMALIVGERQANLVPWRPALERFAGRRS